MTIDKVISIGRKRKHKETGELVIEQVNLTPAQLAELEAFWRDLIEDLRPLVIKRLQAKQAA